MHAYMRLCSVPKSDRTTVHKNLIVALGIAELLLMCSDWASAYEVRLHVWYIYKFEVFYSGWNKLFSLTLNMNEYENI